MNAHGYGFSFGGEEKSKIPVGWHDTTLAPPPLYVTVEVKMTGGNESSAFAAKSENGNWVFESGNVCSHPPLCWRYKQ